MDSRLLKNLSIVFSESIVTKAMSFIVILLLSRYLGPEDYGKYSYIFVAVAFCTAFFDFGMENTTVRFSARDIERTNSIFGLYLFVKLIVVIVFIMVLLIFSHPIFSLLDKEEIVHFVPFLIIGFLGESLLFVNDTYLQAVQRFKFRAVINISRSIISVIFIVFLYYNQTLLLEYVFLLYLLPILGVLLFIHKYIRFLQSFFLYKWPRGMLKEIFNYEKWMLMVSIPNNTISRIDFFIIALWVSYEQIGIYNAAFQLSSIVSFIPFAFGKVMLPKMSEFSENKVFDYTNKIMKTTIIISTVMLCIIPLSIPIIPYLMGEEYVGSIYILQVMLVSAIITFAITPIEQAIYSLGKPKFITIGKYIQIIAIILLIYGTVPYFGVIWAAISVAVARIIYGVILTMLYLNYKNKHILMIEQTSS